MVSRFVCLFPVLKYIYVNQKTSRQSPSFSLFTATHVRADPSFPFPPLIIQAASQRARHASWPHRLSGTSGKSLRDPIHLRLRHCIVSYMYIGPIHRTPWQHARRLMTTRRIVGKASFIVPHCDACYCGKNGERFNGPVDAGASKKHYTMNPGNCVTMADVNEVMKSGRYQM